MQLTQQQIEQMKAKGLNDQTIATLAKQKGYEMPDGRDVLQKTGDVVNKLFAGKQVGQAIGTLGGYAYTKAKDKIQGTDVARQYDLSSPSPLQVAGDIALGATQVAGAKLPVASSILGKTAQFGALGAVSGGSKAVAEGKTVQEVGKETVSEGIKGALTGFTFGVVEKGLSKGTQFLNKTGEKIQYGVIKPSQADVKDGFDIKTIKEFNLGGSLQDTFKKTDSTLDDLSKQLNAKLKVTTNPPIDMNTVYEKTVNKLSGNNFENFGANNQMTGALEKLRGEITTTVGKNGLSSIPEAQLIKRASGHFGAWQFGNPTPEATASQKVYNAFYNELKIAIEEASPEGVKEINKKMSRLIPVMNAVIRRIPVAERNSAISLTDIISLTGATLEPRALGITALNFLSKSGKVGSGLMKVKGLGQGIVKGAEQIGQSLITR